MLKSIYIVNGAASKLLLALKTGLSTYKTRSKVEAARRAAAATHLQNFFESTKSTSKTAALPAETPTGLAVSPTTTTPTGTAASPPTSRLTGLATLAPAAMPTGYLLRRPPRRRRVGGVPARHDADGDGRVATHREADGVGHVAARRDADGDGRVADRRDADGLGCIVGGAGASPRGSKW